MSGKFTVTVVEPNWKGEQELKNIPRKSLRGPGLGLLVENGPQIVLAAATLPTYSHNVNLSEDENSQWRNNNRLYNTGIGSADWLIKRWFPNAVSIQSKWTHQRHPSIVKQTWLKIPGEERAGNQRNRHMRIQKTLEVLKAQAPDVRTLVFANSPETCLAAQIAFKDAQIESCGLHSGVAYRDRLEALKKFTRGEVSVLVCTDLVARGLDLPVCRHIIQLDFAKNATEYLHRVGRAARAGRHSKATNLWGEGDVATKSQIQKVPEMGLTGMIWARRGMRGRLRNIRRKQKRQEMEYGDVRKAARLARYKTVY